MHGLKSDTIVKLFTPLFIKFKSCLQKRLFILVLESATFWRPNIREHSRRVPGCLRSGTHGLTGWFLLFRNFSVAISVSPHIPFILLLVLISMFLR